MAQIGTPSAGWYTDPSGRHRARYWDGVSWTEQVRDDVTDPGVPVPSAGSSSHPTGAPSTGGNPFAAGVAGVAEAVAAVAANDLAQRPAPIAEPGLVVDLGGDAPWDPTGASGTAPAVTDPFAPIGGMSHEAATDPGSSHGFAADPFAGDPYGGAAAVDPSGAPSAPVSSGPAPGWYPDPATRHQARFWDGERWTERVADHGVEGVDPLPGVPGATTGTLEAQTGAWPDLHGHDTGPASGPGTPPSAGQISLASLPDIDEPDAATERRSARPSAKVRIAGGFVLGGAVALLVGSTMTWMEVTGPRVGDQATSTGLDLGDGRITVALGIVLAVLGAAIITGRLSRFGGAKVAAMGSLVAGAAALAVTAVDIADVADRASRLGVPAGAVTNVGTGLWLAFVGALFAVGGGLMAFANRQ